MKRKYHKGEFEYLKEKKKWELLKTLALFGISGLIFIMGYLSTKTKSNYLTIVAVLGCLPASKSMVSLIMYWKIKECEQTLRKEIEAAVGKAGSFHLYFTTYDKNFSVSHLFIKAKTIVAYTQQEKTEEAAFEEHIKTVLKRDGITGYSVKLFKDKEKYLQRIQQLTELETEVNKDQNVVNTLYAVSL